ncbi:MAG: hypothetical protein SPL80_00265 [Bacilli bacterium]|nr:hypothetical protein [Bacilli bacterium]
MRIAAKKFALFLPATFACLSAAQPRPYYWSFGPACDNEPGTVRIKALSSRYQSSWWFVKATLSGRTYQATGKCGDAPRDGDYLLVEKEIPATYFRYGQITALNFGLCQEKYYTGIDFSKISLNIFENVTSTADEGLQQFEEDQIRELKRNIYVYDPDRASRRIIYHEGYEVTGISSGRNLPKRKIPLDELFVDYVNPYLSPKEPQEAELRILTYPEDFASIGTMCGGYLSIPLKASVTKMGNSSYRYRFAAAKGHYVSRIDYRCSDVVALGHEPMLWTKDIYLPLREGHDQGLYRYDVVLHGAGYFSDEIIIKNSVFSSRLFFGPCGEAEYCVVGG